MTRALLLFVAAASITLCARADRGEVVLNEVLVNEPGSQTKLEFVELHNGGGDLVDLSGWDFIDGGSSPDTTALPSGLEIEPFGFAIIADDTLTFLGQWSLPPGTPIVQIKMSLGNSGDSVAVVDDLDGVRKFHWSSGGDDGISIEKILPLEGDDPGNWTASLDPLGVTPGVRNSVTPADIDAALFEELVTMTPGAPRPGDDVEIEARVVNMGAVAIDSAEVSFTIDAVDEFATISVFTLAPGDTGTVEATWLSATAGPHTLTVEVAAPGDEVPGNDSVDLPFTVAGESDITITEVMANPAGGETAIPGGVADEFLELLNRGDSVVDVTGWSLTDGDGVDAIIPWDDAVHGTLEAAGVVTETTLIPAGGYALVLDPEHASPSRGEPQPYSIPAGTIILTVEGSDIGGSGLTTTDPITLYDAGGTGRDDVIDTFGTPKDEEIPGDRDDDGLDGVPFDPGDGISLERIDPSSGDTESNWAQSSEGGTPGAVNSVTPADIDAALFEELVTMTPSAPLPGDDVEIDARLVNQGIGIIDTAEVSFTIDGSDEIATVLVFALAAGDTATAEATWLGATAGPHTLTVEVSATGDEVPGNDLVNISFSVGPSDIAITEVMANPAGGETEIPGGKADEFVELLNRGESVVDVAGWSLTDGDGVDAIIPWDDLTHGTLEAPGVVTGTTLIPAGSHALVLDPDHASPSRGEPQPYSIPAGTVVLTVNGSDIGGSGLAASNDPLTLYDAGGTDRDNVIDTFGTPKDEEDPGDRDDDALDGVPFDPGDGFSLERIDPSSGDTESNWAESSEGGTPGSVNSVTPVARDLACHELYADNPGAAALADLGLTAVVAVAGTTSVSGASLELYLDADLNEILSPAELIGGPTEIAKISPGDTIEIVFEGGLEEGRHRMVAQVSTDDRPTNDRASLDLAVGDVEAFLVVNEFLNRPDEDSGQPEWIEILNGSERDIDLAGWTLGDDEGRSPLLAADDSPIRLAPGAFVVLTQDLDKMRASFPLVDVPVLEPDRWETLNNTDDVITLADPRGFVVDRVPYDDAWRGKRDNEAGVSWERIDHRGNPASEANWWLSVDPSGSTPGRANSLAGGFSSGISLEVGPDPFSPDGNGFQDETAIRYRLPPKSVFTLRVFDSLGRPVRTLVDEVGSANGVFVWDGTDDAGRTLGVGIYILLAEAKGESLMQAKRTVVVARPLR